MIHTVFDQNDVLYSVIKNSPLNGNISGGIYHDKRPDDSDKEDVVINSITMDGEMIQRGTANVNLHIPMISATINGKPQKQPNRARAVFLTNLIKDKMKEGYGDKYNYWTDTISYIRDPSTENYFINFRIQFKMHNT